MISFGSGKEETLFRRFLPQTSKWLALLHTLPGFVRGLKKTGSFWHLEWAVGTISTLTPCTSFCSNLPTPKQYLLQVKQNLTKERTGQVLQIKFSLVVLNSGCHIMTMTNTIVVNMPATSYWLYPEACEWIQPAAFTISADSLTETGMMMWSNKVSTERNRWKFHSGTKLPQLQIYFCLRIHPTSVCQRHTISCYLQISCEPHQRMLNTF